MLDLVSSIIKYAQLIKEQADVATANKEKCKELAGRVVRVAEAVKGLNDKSNIYDRPNYSMTLTELNNCLASCLDFIGKHDGTKPYTLCLLTDGLILKKVIYMLKERGVCCTIV